MAEFSSVSISSELITAAQVEANMSCYVCLDDFSLDEPVSRLVCAHIFHQACITPWLQLHPTCPVCRRRLLPPAPAFPLSSSRLRFTQQRLSPLPFSPPQPFSPLRYTPLPLSPTPESQPNTPTSPRLPYRRLRWRDHVVDSRSSSLYDGSMNYYFDY